MAVPLCLLPQDGTLWETDACLEYMQHMERTRGWEQVDTVGTYEALLKAKGKERAYGYCAQLFDGMSLDGIARSCAESFQANVKGTVFPEMAELLRILKARGWEVRTINHHVYLRMKSVVKAWGLSWVVVVIL